VAEKTQGGLQGDISAFNAIASGSAEFFAKPCNVSRETPMPYIFSFLFHVKHLCKPFLRILFHVKHSLRVTSPQNRNQTASELHSTVRFVSRETKSPGKVYFL
jgi:hypothetical protein